MSYPSIQSDWDGVPQELITHALAVIHLLILRSIKPRVMTGCYGRKTFSLAKEVLLETGPVLECVGRYSG